MSAPQATSDQSRYDIWCDALVLTYTGDACGIPVGASYADVLRWLPAMRPYRGPEGGSNPEFRDIVLAITHLVYTLNDYNRYRLPPELLPQEVEFLQENLNEPLAANDAELLGEFVDCLRAFGLPDSDSRVSAGMEYLLASQNPDGSWGDVHEPGCSHPVPHCLDCRGCPARLCVAGADGMAGGGGGGAEEWGGLERTGVRCTEGKGTDA